ncbi:probable choline kinase 3 [Nylanderia fulva]|uniref:probable choline kinase 3 n=1 Tax=Nylanderia fulva TaxID=613905 RepID=UPI0010FB3F08|nr:probable choline kinase 3 [Nylanderia fulva]
MIGKDHSIEVQRKIGFPKILWYEENYVIERYIDFEEVNWERDMKEIALELKRFHSQKCKLEYSVLLEYTLQSEMGDMRNRVLERIKNEIFEVIKGEKLSLCHNDLQLGNMMKIKGGIKFIDFEYTTMGNAYADIANLFCEKMCDYEEDSVLKVERGWSVEKKKEFLRIYEGKEDVEVEYEKVCKREVIPHFFWLKYLRDGGMISEAEHEMMRIEIEEGM